MPRPPRIEREDGLFHVTSRGNARVDIFRSDPDRERFLDQLADNLESYEVVLLAYVLMGNHYHLVVRTPRANLSRFMQRLNTSYALYARYKHGRPGHVFQGRFRAKIVESDRYLRQVCRYVHLNPVRTRAAARLDVRERLEALDTYRWSSYPGTVRASQGEEFVDCGAILRLFGDGGPASRRAYGRYVRSAAGATDEKTLDLMRSNPYTIGSAEFADAIAAELDARRTGGEADRDVDLPRRVVAIEAIDAAVAEAYGIAPGDLRRHGRAVGHPKAVAMELARTLSGLNQRQIGAHYGGVTSSAVAMNAARLRRDRTKPPTQVQETLEAIRETRV